MSAPMTDLERDASAHLLGAVRAAYGADEDMKCGDYAKALEGARAARRVLDEAEKLLAALAFSGREEPKP